MFADADVVVAAHGAGLTNTMFMRPGSATCLHHTLITYPHHAPSQTYPVSHLPLTHLPSPPPPIFSLCYPFPRISGGLVVEVVPVFDSRHAPVIGIFPRLSGIIGLHHYTYYIGNMLKFTAAPLLKVVESYAREIGVSGVTSPS